VLRVMADGRALLDVFAEGTVPGGPGGGYIVFFGCFDLSGRSETWCADGFEIPGDVPQFAPTTADQCLPLGTLNCIDAFYTSWMTDGGGSALLVPCCVDAEPI